MRKNIKYIIFPFVISLCLFLLLHQYVIDYSLRKFIKPYMINKISDMLNVDFNIGDIRFILLKGRVMINKIKVDQPRGFSGNLMVEIDNIDAQVKVVPVIFSRIIIIWAKKIFEWFFKEGAIYSTTHFFIRQNARYIIELGLLYDAKLFSDKDLEFIRPSYSEGGNREWGELDLGDIGPFESGAYPFRMENFGKYILSPTCKDGLCC